MKLSVKLAINTFLAISLLPLSLFSEENRFLSIKEPGLLISFIERVKDQGNLQAVSIKNNLPDAILIELKAPATTKYLISEQRKTNKITIDIPRVNLRRSRVYDIEGNPYISSVELTSAKRNSRLTLNLKGKKLPRYNWSSNKGDFFLSIPINSKKTPTKSIDELLFDNQERFELGTVRASPDLVKLAGREKFKEQPSVELPEPQSITPVKFEDFIAGKLPTQTSLVKKSSLPVKAETQDNNDEIQIFEAPSNDSQIKKLEKKMRAIKHARLVEKASVVPTPRFSNSERALAKLATRFDLTPSVTPLGKHISKIEFSANDEQMLSIQLSERTQFSFSKVDNNSYVLSIPAFALKTKALALPLFPTQDVQGIASVLAREVSGNLEITVYSEDNAKLEAVASGTEILINLAVSGN